MSEQAHILSLSHTHTHTHTLGVGGFTLPMLFACAKIAKKEKKFKPIEVVSTNRARCMKSLPAWKCDSLSLRMNNTSEQRSIVDSRIGRSMA